MSQIEEVGQEMQRHIFDLIEPLQKTKEINEDAFLAADKAARLLASLLKGHDLLKRDTLDDLDALDMAGNILENEAPYTRDEQRVMAMSEAFRFTLGLILSGVSHEDRQPGVADLKTNLTDFG